DEVQVEYMGRELIDDAEMVHLKISSDPSFDLFINPETALPALIRYSQFNPQQGARQTIEVYYSEWQVNDGVAYAYESVSYANGEAVSRTNVKSHSVE
ncbi:MAG: hypothetical protein ACFCU6_01190, partial [Balneolaceae bacterium]